jgi:hypothetical protein
LALRYLVPERLALGDGTFIDVRAIVDDKPRIYRDNCLLGLEETAQPPCRYGSHGGRKTVLLFGDSHAGNWFTPLDRAAGELGWSLVVRIKAACPPVNATRRRSDGSVYEGCDVWREKTLLEIAALKPDLIVVGSTPNRFSKAAERDVLSVLAAASPTVVMRDTPWFKERTDDCLRKRKAAAKCEWPLRQTLKTPSYPTLALEELPPRTELLDLNSRVCPDNRCRAILNGIPVMTDNHHFTETFAATFTDVFTSLLERY